MDRKHCLVTGANRGLGRELATQLLDRQWHVVATCRHPGKATALNRLAGEHSGRLHVLPLDVADARSRDALLPELSLAIGEQPLHLLINNAGVLRGGERFGQVAAEDMDLSFHTHAAGPFLLAQALAPRLAEGAVVANISSEIGSIALRQEFRTPSYAIGKAAQNMVTSLLSQAFGATRHQRRRPASGLGSHRHGRRQRRTLRGRVGHRAAAGDRPPHARRQRAFPRLAGRTAALVKLNAGCADPQAAQRFRVEQHPNTFAPE